MTDLLEGIPWFAGLLERRLHLGLENPNTTGAVIACLLVSVWGLMCGGKKWVYFCGVVFTLPLSIALALTESRGALVALWFGAALLLLVHIGRKSPWTKFSGIIFCLAAATALFLTMPSGSRVSGVSEDPSISTRWTVFSQVPSMVVAAPDGWGVERSAEAYQHWFQPIGDHTKFKHILSTHAIWFVERGWLLGWVYTFLWSMAFVVCIPWRQDPIWWSGASACIATLAVSMAFSHVGERLETWALPACWLLIVLLSRFQTRSMPALGTAALAMLAPVAVTGAILAWTQWENSTVLVKISDGVVSLRASEGIDTSQKIAVAFTTPVAGEWFGQQLRSGIRPSTAVDVAWDNPPKGQYSAWLLAGDLSQSMMPEKVEANQVVWINPPFAVPKYFNEIPISVFWGQFRSGSPAQWRKHATSVGGSVTMLSGCGEFVSESWPLFLDRWDGDP